MLAITITRGTETFPVHALNGSLNISKEIGVRGENFSFSTHTQIQEWDIVEVREAGALNIVYNSSNILYDGDNVVFGGGTLLFSGIIESVDIKDIIGDATVFSASSGGWNKLMDRAVIERRFTNVFSGDLLRQVILEFIPDFSDGYIEQGILIESFPVNALYPSDVLDMLAEANGFTWKIDSLKRIFFQKQTRNASALIINEDNNFCKNLIITPNIEEIVNVVTIRGGYFLSPITTFSTKGNGEMRQFVLPDKPKNVSVFVNGSEKSIAPKFGETAPTAEFLINYNEKYIENGVYATLTAGDTIEVVYQYDIPLRYQYKDLTSIANMQAMFPDTNGIFEKVIEDKDIEDRGVAEERAKAEIEAKGNPIISGSFKTFAQFTVGDVLSVDIKGYKKEVVITRIVSRSLGGGVLEHTVTFSTVLFHFEDFLRKLLRKNKLSINENEVVENIESFPENLLLGETVYINAEDFIHRESIKADEAYYVSTTVPEFIFVYGDYMPTSSVDVYRNGLYGVAQYA